MKVLIAAGDSAGYTLIELMVVGLVIGILASIAAPQYFKTVEKSKAAEAVQILMAVKGAQDRYFNRYSQYCIGPLAGCAGFDIPPTSSKYFDGALPNAAAGTGNPSWSMTLTRNAAPAVYGAYSIKYDGPNASPALSCSLACNELLPSIH